MTMVIRFNSVHKSLKSPLEVSSLRESEKIDQYPARSHDLLNSGYKRGSRANGRSHIY